MNGLTTWLPVNAPRLPSAAGSPSAMRSMSVSAAARVRNSSTATRCSAVVSSSTSGCSGARTAYVMPKLVSGRVVNTRTVRSGRPSTGRSNSAPSDRPIQLRCMVLARSGHSRPSRASRSSSAYWVMRKNHCSRSRLIDDVAGALAGAVGQDLLVGQHGLAPGAPVDRRHGAVGQAGLPEAQEDELAPLDVAGVVAVHLAAPVVDGAEAPERRA